MATTADLLLDSLGRSRETAHQVLDDTPEELLATPPAPGTNTVAWLVWHLTRGLDEQVAERPRATTPCGRPAAGASGFALPLPADAHGYGMTFDEVLLGAGLAPSTCAATSTPPSTPPPRPCAPSPTPTSTGSSTSTGTRRSPSPCGWSASSTTAPSTSGQAAYASGILSRR